MAVQLRLGFDPAASITTLNLGLSGVFVIVDSDETTNPQILTNLLTTVNIATITEGESVKFSVSHLSALLPLTKTVKITVESDMQGIWDLIRLPSDANRPIHVDVLKSFDLETNGHLVLTWTHAGLEQKRVLPPGAAGAVLTGGVAFVATPAAFDVLGVHNQLPLIVGKCVVNPDWFIEISTTTPQLVESAPLPGLFRVNATTLGMALPYAQTISSLPGFIWDTKTPPIAEAGPSVDAATFPMTLSDTVNEELQQLIDGLVTHRAQAVIWNSGLGRRIFVSSALHVIDAWPALVVTPASNIWLWLRHAQLLDRTAGVEDPEADFQIVTPERLAALGGWPRSMQAVIFDDPGVYADSQAVRYAASRLGSLTDTLRIIVAPAQPTSPQVMLKWMSLIRPSEFLPDIPVPVRYPPDSLKRLTEHFSAYLSRKTTSSTEHLFSKSKILTLPPSDPQLEALERIHARSGAPAAGVLADALEIISAGTAYVTSPKVAAAAELASEALTAGRRAAVITRHRRTASLIQGLLHAYNPISLTTADWPGEPITNRAVVLRFDRTLPDLKWFDVVIFIDWPWSLQVITDAVGSGAATDGPDQIFVLHSPNTVDDRLVIAASKRVGIETASVAKPPTDAQAAWLLSRTTAPPQY